MSSCALLERRNIVQKMAHIFTFVNKTVLTNYSCAAAVMLVLLPRRQELKVRQFIFLSASPQSDRFCTNDLHRTFGLKFRLKVQQLQELLHAGFVFPLIPLVFL